MRLILASSSPRRAELLRAAGYTFDIHPAEIDERVRPGESRATFVRLTEDQIAWYVASAEGADKAGAYAIQGLASRFVTKIDGSYSNVVGLPVAAVDALIQRLSRPSGVLASQG